LPALEVAAATNSRYNVPGSMGSLRRYGLLLLCAAALCAPAGAATIKEPQVTVFRGDGNYTKASRKPSEIHFVVVHVTEGRFWGSVGWLQSEHAEASANYVVSRAGKIVQLVHLSDIAWHSGNAQMNRESVGIEHTGVTDSPAGFTPREYRASARLAAWLCRRSLIPIDRQHILGHSEVFGADHTDPGRYWNWPLYIKLVKRYAYPKPFPKLRVRSTTLHDGQTLAGNVPWKAKTLGPKATRVDFLIDGKLKWRDHRAPFAFAGGRPLKTLGLRNGRHRLQLVAYGRSGHSAAHEFRVRVRNRRLELTTAGIRKHARLSGIVKLRAATTVPTPAIKVYLDGRLVQQRQRKPFAFSLDLRKIVNGLHTIDLKTTDTLGRTAGRRIPVVVANPLPVPPAQLVSQSLTEGQSVQGVVPWQVTASGAVVRVEFLIDDAVRATATAAPYTYAWDTVGEPAGPHTLGVRIVGKDGRAVRSAPLTVTVGVPAA
jgi:N-acetyl-anhydromuramyl-L-alanine amidase AmpD